MKNIMVIGASGRMGSVTCQKLALLDEVTTIIGMVNPDSIKKAQFQNHKLTYTDDLSDMKKADIIIDFSLASAFDKNIQAALTYKKPLVICVTNLDEKQIAYLNDHVAKQIPVLHASNTSIGIALIKSLLQSMPRNIIQNYDIDIVEHHHKNKIDSPSGTAKMLTKAMKHIVDKKDITTHAIRSGHVFCNHEIRLTGEREMIRLSHDCADLQVFANGAIDAARWLMNKNNGYYNMEDLFVMHSPELTAA